MMRICGILEMQNLGKNEVVDLSKEHEKNIFFLKKGTVKIVNSVDGTTKYIVKKGNIFGELSLFEEDNISEEQAIALENCVICYIESERMGQFMEKYQSLKNEVFKVYGFRIKN